MTSNRMKQNPSYNTTLKHNETQVTITPFSPVCNEVLRIIASTTKTNAMILNRLTGPNQLLIISTLIIGYFKNAAQTISLSL